MKKSARKNKTSLTTPARLTARTADKHILYQKSVQAPDYEVQLLHKLYKKAYGKKALSMREDFCGTAILCAAWAKSDKERTATGVDLCEETLAWGKKHNIEPLGEAQSRVTLIQDDVRAPRKTRFEIINALNFSYWVFKTRAELKQYFEGVRASLGPSGMFLCDAYGGWESQEPMLEPRRVAGGFTYVWDQHSFDPITHDVVNHIHFEFKDGTKLNRAFTYEWRFWSLPEITELLREAGFKEVHVYWDQAEEDTEENYRRSTRAENQPGWLAYIVALK
jgi:SAM-dependent methyltransferase